MVGGPVLGAGLSEPTLLERASRANCDGMCARQDLRGKYCTLQKTAGWPSSDY